MSQSAPAMNFEECRAAWRRAAIAHAVQTTPSMLIAVALYVLVIKFGIPEISELIAQYPGAPGPVVAMLNWWGALSIWQLMAVALVVVPFIQLPLLLASVGRRPNQADFEFNMQVRAARLAARSQPQ